MGVYDQSFFAITEAGVHDVQENKSESRLAWFSIVFFLVMNPVTNALIIAKRLFM